MPGAHSLLSPSAAERWMFCPGSVALTKDMPEETSPYAEEGSMAHRLCELLARDVFKSDLTDDEKAELEEHRKSDPAEMLKAADEYVKEITSIISGREVDYIDFEHVLDVSAVTTEANGRGTADCLLLVSGELWVVDFKYGAGVPVPVKNNPQLEIYLLSAFAELSMFYRIEKLGACIVQPRMENVARTPLVASDKADKAITFYRFGGARALALCKKAELENGDLRPGEKSCRFCKGKAVCPALRKKVETAVLQEFEDISEKAELAPAVVEAVKSIPVPTTPEALARAYGYLKLIRDWCDAVDERMFSSLRSGQRVPGYKLVAGRAGARKWGDDKAAEEILRKALGAQKAYDKKLISPTAAERLAKKAEIGPQYWKKLQGCITRSETKPAVAPADDSRPEITFNPVDELEALK